jgi:hypothetical protein
MTFVWAHGQSGKEFYKNDELKYHGNPKDDKVITRGSKGKKKLIQGLLY